MASIEVELWTEAVFSPFGRVLGQPESINPNAVREDLEAWVNFSDLLEMELASPMWAFLRIKRHSLPVNRLERHVNAAKAVIPLEGSCVLIVASGGGPDESVLRAFLLDGSKGVFLHRGCWHWVSFSITLTASFLLLVENDIFNDIEEHAIEPSSILY